MELNELRKIAEAVKQEPWVMAGGNEWISPIGITVDYDNGGISSIEAEFIATFDPPTVLALITELETFRRRLDAMRRQRDGYRNQLRKTEQQIQRVRDLHSYGKLVYPNGDEEHYCIYDENAWPCETIRALDGATRRLADQGLGDGQDG